MNPGDEENETQDQAEPEEATSEEDGPDTAELDDDPAYNPDDPDLKGIKGG
jgi:hypothetical protein